MWLETLFVKGMNDDSGEIQLLTESIKAIGPDRIHINTVLRPPAVSRAHPLTDERLREIAAELGPNAEVIASPSSVTQSVTSDDAAGVVTAMAARRPVTAIEVARAVGVSQAAAAKMLNELVDRGVLSVVRHGETLYYRT